jgi:o-succinylbenzoate synthase
MKSFTKTIHLKSPLPIPTGNISKREVMIFEHNQIFFELSPLPGLSIESLEQAYNQITPYLIQLEHLEKNNHYDLTKPLFNLLEYSGELFPSVQFALEQYMFKMCDLSIPNHTLQTHTFIPDLMSNHIFGPDQFIKIKIGKYNPEIEIRMIRKLMNDNQIILRLDGNQSLSHSDFSLYLTLLEDQNASRIDYFEEPLRDIEKYNGSPFPFAVDENLPKLSSLLKNSALKLKAIVYKPTIMGGISKVLSLRNHIRFQTIPIVLSSSYESSVATRTMFYLGQHLDSIGPITRHGLVHIE